MSLFHLLWRRFPCVFSRNAVSLACAFSGRSVRGSRRCRCSSGAQRCSSSTSVSFAELHAARASPGSQPTRWSTAKSQAFPVATFSLFFPNLYLFIARLSWQPEIMCAWTVSLCCCKRRALGIGLHSPLSRFSSRKNYVVFRVFLTLVRGNSCFPGDSSVQGTLVSQIMVVRTSHDAPTGQVTWITKSCSNEITWINSSQGATFSPFLKKKKYGIGGCWFFISLEMEVVILL